MGDFAHEREPDKPCRLCNKTITELRDMLEWCERGKEYHQAIISLIKKIERGFE